MRRKLTEAASPLWRGDSGFRQEGAKAPADFTFGVFTPGEVLGFAAAGFFTGVAWLSQRRLAFRWANSRFSSWSVKVSWECGQLMLSMPI